MTPNSSAETVASISAKLAAAARDSSLEDAVFRARAKRLASQLVKLIPAQGAASRRPGGPAYHFITVDNGSGGTSSVSVRKEVFEALVEALGSRKAVTDLARKAALKYEPNAGLSRSAFVRLRLEQRAKVSRKH